MKQISENIYAETAQPGCNPGFVVTREGVVMIDSPQQPSYVSVWKQAMEEKGEIRYLINTEHHRDHIIGNFFFTAPIIAHEKTREGLATVPMESIMEKIKQCDPQGYPMMKGFCVRQPAITFNDELTLHMGGHTLKLLHLPGHTAGMTAVFIPEERVVFTGDNIFCRVQTFLHQAYPDQWLDSLKKIGELDVDVIVPGHGGLCDKAYLKEQTAFIEEWISAVREAKRQGLSKEEAQNKISFLDRYPMDTGLTRERGIEVQRMNVSRLYDFY